MTDDVSNAELARRLDTFQRDVHQDFAEIFRRMDTYVLREVYAAEKKAMEAQLAQLQQRVKDGEDQRRAVVRWLISAIVVPIVILVVQVVLTFQAPT